MQRLEQAVVEFEAEQRVTVKDVAKLAGVSTATVSRTLADADRVVPKTRERVLSAVEQLGYRPNPMARDLRQGGRTGAVGLVIASFTNTFQMGVAAGAERELRSHGLQLVIGSTDLDESREPELARAMADRRVSVLMMMPDGHRRDFLVGDRLFKTPVVLVGRPADGLDVDVVMTNDDAGVAEATEALIDLGHRDIAALAGAADSFRASQRIAGFRDAMKRRGIAVRPELEVLDLLTVDDAAAASARLFSLDAPPTAVLALNLGISTGALLDRFNNKRPGALISVDESEMTAGLGITAIVRDPEELGRQAAALAVARIAEPERMPQVVDLPTQLIKRGSGEIAPS